VKLSKAQKRAQHLEQQKQLWDSAENPDRFHWLETQGVVPLKQEFKPQLTLLSRKPVAPTIVKKDGSNGVADEGDSEEEDRKKRASELEERKQKAKLEREEKQRKYAEARERIMGTSSPTPAPASPSRDREGRKARTKVNGSASRGSQPTSSADQSPARPLNGGASLFDPEDMGRRLPRREAIATSSEELPLRQPRGPDNSGRGGAGFARGGKAVP